MNDEFRSQLAWGADGEHTVARALMHRGVVLLPLFQFSDLERAPAVVYETDGRGAHFVAPDLTCFKSGRVFFAEVKRKRRWVAWNGRRETGFNSRLFDEYQGLTRRTGVPLYCFFVHELVGPTGVFVARLDELAPTVRRWDGRAPTGHRIGAPLALFDASVLRRMCSLEELQPSAQQEATP